ncbi:MAG: hypothetical protein AAGA45_06105 [Verrucomicrobiota bacterium]
MPDPEPICFKPAALIRVTGEDAPDYLQSQFSNDLSKSIPGSVTYGLWLDRKGKVQADSFVFHLGEEEYLLMSYFCTASALIAKLDENIIADEVEMEDATAGSCIAVYENEAVALSGGFVFSDRLGNTNRVAILYPQPESHLLEQALAPDALAYGRIAAGIPAVPQDIGPSDLPQEGGLDKDAVSFNKGCYLGQEVMARLDAMGRTTRVLHRVSLSALPAARLPIAIATADGKSAGELRSVAEREGHIIGLAMLKNRAVESGAELKLASGETLKSEHALA